MDTKYKEISGNPPADHVYQVHSYSVDRTKKCVLIYASTKNVGKNDYPLTGDVTLYTLHFNLASTSKEEFELNCSHFLKEVMNIIHTH